MDENYKNLWYRMQMAKQDKEKKTDIPTEHQQMDPSKISYTDNNQPSYTINEKYPGMVKPGNIDIANRPSVSIDNGQTATVRSVNFEIDKNGTNVLIPTIGPAGENWTMQEAINHYKATGQNLGYFKDSQSAVNYAIDLHNQQQQQYVDNNKDNNQNNQNNQNNDPNNPANILYGGNK